MDRNPAFSPIYTIPGLGTDSALFEAIDPEYLWRRIAWQLPTYPQESLANYAMRLASLIPSEEVPFLLGVSFGGVVAQEIARIRPVAGIVLISSLVDAQEKPWWMPLFEYVPLYRLGVGEWRIKTLPLWAPSWGITDPQEQALLQAMFRRADDRLRFWSLRQLIIWEAPSMTVPTLRLHGTRDSLFSVRHPQTCTLLEGGTHFMVWQQARQLRALIDAWIEAKIGTGM